MDTTLPEKCFTMDLQTHAVIVIKRGESGFYKTDYDNAGKAANQDLIDHINGDLGITTAQVLAMEMGSMFGWDVPGAYAKTHEEFAARRAAAQGWRT